MPGVFGEITQERKHSVPLISHQRLCPPMHLQRIVHLVAVVFAVFETFVRASYYLDDRDSSITYVGPWFPGDHIAIDVKKLYNGT